MIIPIKCVTCGEVLADKYRYYKEKVKEIKLRKGLQTDKVVYFTQKSIEGGGANIKKTPEGEILDQIHVYNVCCRRTMLTHVDIE